MVWLSDVSNVLKGIYIFSWSSAKDWEIRSAKPKKLSEHNFTISYNEMNSSNNCLDESASY